MRPLVIVLGIVGVLVSCLTGPLGASPEASSEIQSVTVVMTGYRFSPSTVTLRAGVPVELTLVNKGNMEHDFSVYPVPPSAPKDWDAYVTTKSYFQDMDEVGVTFPRQGAVAGTRIFETEVSKGTIAVLDFTPTRKGVFEMGCHVTGHYEAGMKGSFIVK